MFTEKQVVDYRNTVGFEVGDKVKIVGNKTLDLLAPWEYTNEPRPSKVFDDVNFKDQTYTIQEFKPEGRVGIRDLRFVSPMCLEIVKKAPKEIVEDTGLTFDGQKAIVKRQHASQVVLEVGCQVITFKQVEDIYELMKKVNGTSILL